MKDKKQDALRKCLFRKQHPEKHRSDQKKYYDRNKEKVIRRRKWKRNCWNSDAFNLAIKKQKKRCAICGSKFSRHNKPCADHNHKTKKPRGVLCYHCNWMLGHAKDSPKILKLGAEYLKTHRQSSQ